jgi:rhamnosyltransferase
VDKIIYIDNCSTYEIPVNQWNREKIILIKNNENLGLGKAQNQGITIAQNNHADYILLLDQDSILAQNMVPVLLNEYKQNENQHVAAVCPVIKNAFDGSIQKNGIISLGFKIQTQDISKTLSVEYAISSGSLIYLGAINKVGLINEKFFIDEMDIEWCLRAKYFGFKILQTPNTYLIHQLGNGDKQKILNHSSLREFYIIRNSFLLIRFPYVTFGFKIRRIILGFSRILYSLFHGYFSHFKMGVKGFWQALTMKM